MKPTILNMESILKLYSNQPVRPTTVLGLTLPALADSVKEIAGIVHTAKTAKTAQEKAAYHVQAEGRIEDATAGLRQYLWTLYYKGQE